MSTSQTTSLKDRLQSSAKDWWSSLRSADEGISRSNSNYKAPSFQQMTGNSSVSLEKLDSLMRVMFGSCTSGMDANVTPTSTTDTKSIPQSALHSRMTGDHVYAQLFLDDEAQVVNPLGTHNGENKNPSSASFSRPVSRHFPISTPPRRNQQILLHNVPSPATTKEVEFNPNASFDDGISAISAHTLEELVRVAEPKRGPLPTRQQEGHRSPSVEANSQHSATKISGEMADNSYSTPMKFSRGRSHGTYSSKGTRSSKATKSTNSTKSSDFASYWRKEERKYWNDEVEKDEKCIATVKVEKKHADSHRRSRSSKSSKSSQLGQDLTITTVNSSTVNSVWSSKGERHPHETHYFEEMVDDCFFEDTRFDIEDLVRSNLTEIGEI